jgi:Putative zinc-finger
MTRHVSTEKLARFRDGDLRPAAARRVTAHLAGCTRCQEASAALAELPALLAAADVPPIPAHLAARIEMALATESAHRAAGSPSMRTASPRSAGHATQRRRRGPLPFPARRILAAAAVLVAVAGGYELVSRVAVPRTTSGASSSSAGRARSAAGQPAAGSAAGSARSSAVAGPAVPGVAGVPAFGPPLRYQHAGHAAVIRPLRSATDYQPALLAQQVSAALARNGVAATAAPGRQAGVSPQHLATFGPAQLTQLAGCVSRVADGRLVLLVDVARYRGAPATVIVTAGPARAAPPGSAATPGALPGSATTRAWVVGPGCSQSGRDILARQALPGR